MAEAHRRSALAGIAQARVEQTAVSLTELRAAELLRICAGADGGELTAALRKILALDAPPPGIAAEREGRALLWLAPRQWLLVSEGERSALGERELASALAPTTGTVVDVSHAYLALRISGARARDVLAKGVPVDLDTDAFPSGACLQTCLADMNVLLHARAVSAIDLYVGRSYAASLWEWLESSAAEFGFA